MDIESHLRAKDVSNTSVPNESRASDQLIMKQTQSVGNSQYRKRLNHNSNASSQSQTTKADDTAQGIGGSQGISTCAREKKDVANKKKDEQVYYTDDLLFEEFQVKGIVDGNLDSKINEYKTNLSINSLNVKEECAEDIRTHSLSLRIELNMMKNSWDCATTQLSNLKSLVGLKEKKLEILENALSLMATNCDVEPKSNTIPSPKSENNPSNFKRKKNHSMNFQSFNFLKEKDSSTALTSIINNHNAITNTTEVNIINTDTTHPNDGISFRNYKRNTSQKEQCITDKKSDDNNNNNIITINQGENNEISEEIDKKKENLKKELLELIASQNKEIYDLSESLNTKYSVEIKNEKLKYEEKMRELNSENVFLFNNLQIEIEFLSNKMKNRESCYIEYEQHRKELEDKIEALKCKRCSTMERYIYYRSLLSNLYQIGKTEEDKKAALSKYKTHNRSHSFNQQMPQKDESTVLSHLDCDIVINTNQESQSTRKNISVGTELNINTLQLNYGSENENALIIPYPILAKAAKNKITFDKKSIEKSTSNKSMLFGNISKISSASAKKNDRTCNQGMSTNINQEDYMSNSAVVEIQHIRTFKTKFINP